MVKDCMALSVDGSGTATLPKWRCLIVVYFRRCEGRLVLDWMCLRKFSSDFCKNLSGSNSLMVRDCLFL